MATIFKNFGFLWDRELVNWGKGGKKGDLIGVSQKKQAEKVDFRKQIGVYALYDKNEQIVYVGKAGNGNADLFKRLKQHRKDYLWNRWKYFSWVGFYSVSDTTDLNGVYQLDECDADDFVSTGYRYSEALTEVEAVLIELIEPKLNKQGTFLSKKMEYRQYVSDDSDDDVEE